MPPKRTKKVVEEEEEEEEIQSSTVLKGCVIACSGSNFEKSQSEILALVDKLGGTTAKTFSAKLTHVVTTQKDFDRGSTLLTKAIGAKLFIINEQFITDCCDGTKKDELKYLIKDDDEEEEEEEEEEKSTSTSTTTTSTSINSKHLSEKGDSDSESESETEKKSTKRSTKKQNTGKKSKEDKEKEEQDLMKEKLLAEIDSDLDSDSDSEPENKKKITVKGRAAVDMHFDDKETYHVYDDGTNVYDSTLNQAEIATNNNKFYIIQVLQSDDLKKIILFNRWGRAGLKGQQKEFPHKTITSAINDFKYKFKEKTKNNWDDRKNFRKVSGKYDMVEIDYTEQDEEEKKPKKKSVVHKKECSLDQRVQDFISLIFDVKMMKRSMVEASIDINKMPLGKLSKAQIKKGYIVLKEIEQVLLNKSNDNLTSLSSRFYTAIPHVFGMKVPTVINNIPLLKAKMDMLENLADIEIAQTLIKESADDNSNLLEAYYKQLKSTITPVDPQSEEYSHVLKYVKNTYQGQTPKVKALLRLDREGEKERFDGKKGLGNRKLLWHGSRLTNFVGIISQGLRIAPPEAPVSGYRFGKGIYFADIMSLSAAYCRTSGSNDFCMFLGDVALGKTADLQRDTYMEKPQPGSHSTLALGSIEPDPKDKHDHPEGYVIPFGSVVPSGHTQVSCREHQYVVYDVAQCNLRYILQLKN